MQSEELRVTAASEATSGQGSPTLAGSEDRMKVDGVPPPEPHGLDKILAGCEVFFLVRGECNVTLARGYNQPAVGVESWHREYVTLPAFEQVKRIWVVVNDTEDNLSFVTSIAADKLVRRRCRISNRGVQPITKWKMLWEKKYAYPLCLKNPAGGMTSGSKRAIIFRRSRRHQRFTNSRSWEHTNRSVASILRSTGNGETQPGFDSGLKLSSIDVQCARRRPPVSMERVADSGASNTHSPDRPEWCESSLGISKAGERCCCASSGVSQRSRTADVGWLAEGESQPSTRVGEIFAGRQRHRIQSVT